MKEKVKEFFLSNWTLSEKCLLIADILLLGVLIGWLTSTIRKGISILSHNSWEIGAKCVEEAEEEEE